MLKNAILFAVSGVAIVAFAPSFLPMLTANAPQPTARKIEAPAYVASSQPAAKSGDEHEISLRADGQGQYWTDVLLNGQTVHMVVDTGASIVVVSADTADRLGLRPALGEPQVIAQTASGRTLTTPTTLSTVALGPIFMTDVRAIILDRSAGQVNLLGTNFLKRLASVEQRDGALYLRQ